MATFRAIERIEICLGIKTAIANTEKQKFNYQSNFGNQNETIERSKRLNISQRQTILLVSSLCLFKNLRGSFCHIM